jgi:hypothetical protein
VSIRVTKSLSQVNRSPDQTFNPTAPPPSSKIWISTVNYCTAAFGRALFYIYPKMYRKQLKIIQRSILYIMKQSFARWPNLRKSKRHNSTLLHYTVAT